MLCGPRGSNPRRKVEDEWKKKEKGSSRERMELKGWKSGRADRIKFRQQEEGAREEKEQ